MNDTRQTDQNIVSFDEFLRRGFDCGNDDYEFVRYISRKIQASGELNASVENSKNCGLESNELLEQTKFSQIFGFMYNKRGRLALLILMETYQLTITEVRRFRSVGYLRWNGTELRLEVCPFSLLYGLATSLVFAIIFSLLFFTLVFEICYCRAHVSGVILALVIYSALAAWTYVVMLKPFWELRRARAIACSRVAG